MKIKSEGGLQERALALCRANPAGVTQEQIQNNLSLTEKECLELVNFLLATQRVEPLSKDGSMLFKERNPELAMKMKGLTTEDLLVYQEIQRSGSTGVWSKDLKRHTNIAQTQVNKILKTLESRQLIKSVKSVNAGNKKILVLFELEPASEVTGGLWYAGQEMDTEFIQVLQQQCKKYIEERGQATVPELHNFIQSARILTVPLGTETITHIVRTLHYDGVLELVPREQAATWRIAGFQIPNETAFTSFPCGVCPVIKECVPGGVISPQTCVYFDKYLQF